MRFKKQKLRKFVNNSSAVSKKLLREILKIEKNNSRWNFRSKQNK